MTRLRQSAIAEDDLRENTDDQEHNRNDDPKKRVFKANLGFSHFARDENERQERNDDQASTQDDAHSDTPPIFFLKNCMNKIDTAMRSM